MRCLYCGKELALLKRWTGGGEFCSDAHRQQYQDEYNQLALNRLLQAKPPGSSDRTEPKADPKAEPAVAQEASKPSRTRTAQAEKAPEKPAEKQIAASTKPVAKAMPAIEAPKPQPIKVAEPERIPERTPEPEPEPEIEFIAEETPEPELIEEYVQEEDEEPAPCEMSGFLVELPVPALAEVMAMSRADAEFESSASPAIPDRLVEAWETQLVSAGRIDYVPYNGIVDFVTSPRDRKLDVREFVRSKPVVEIDLLAAGNEELPQMIEEPMEILIFPHPPQGSPPLADEPWREFLFEKELGTLARVPFRTTGMEDNEDASDPIDSLSDAGVSLASPTPSPAPAAVSTPAVVSTPSAVSTPAAVSTVDRAALTATMTGTQAKTERPAEARQDSPRAKETPQKDETRSAPKPVAPPAGPEPRATDSRVPEPKVVAEPTPARSTFLRPPLAAPASKPAETVAAVAKTPEVVKAPVTEVAKAHVVPEATKPAEAAKATEVPKVPEVAAPAPPVTRSLPLTLHGLAAGRGKPVQIFSAVTAGVDVQIPRSTSLPLRPVMTLEPVVEKVEKTIEKAPEKVEEKKPERTVVVKTDPRKGQPGRPDPRFANGKGRKDNRPAEPEKSEPEIPQKPEQKPIAASISVKTPEKPVEKPAAKTIERTIEKETAPAEKTVAKPVARPAIIEEKRERVRDTSLPAPISAPYTPPDLGLPSLNLEASGGFWSRLPVAGKAGVAVLLVAVIGGAFFMMRGGGAVAAGPQIVEAPAITAAEGGWITDWGAEPGVRKAREISVLRPSLNMTDYRISFEAQIESKALGWIYRAQDAKNFYVSKLEIVKPGLEPTVALVRYAVVNGEEQPHSQFPLTMPLRIDTLYKIRFDALGSHFTTWVQDQKVDDWTDERLKTGGVGLYSDRGERISLKGSMRVAPLVLKK